MLEPSALQEHVPRPTSDLRIVTVLNLSPVLELIPVLVRLLGNLVLELDDFKTKVLEFLKFTRFRQPVVIFILPESQLLEDSVVFVNHCVAIAAVLRFIE